jgi:hypothetical protein
LDNRKIEIERFEEVVAFLAREFPYLVIEVERGQAPFEASAQIPAQRGLVIPVNLNLQNADELHLNVGDDFWVEWFPCSDDEVFARYCSALRGVLSGEHRIVESRIFGRVVSGDLQQPDGDGWKTIASWSNLGCCVPLPRRTRIIQNIGV